MVRKDLSAMPNRRCAQRIMQETMEFDLDYARDVIRTEAGAIAALTPIVDDAFARAAEMIYQCAGSAIISGIGIANQHLLK